MRRTVRAVLAAVALLVPARARGQELLGRAMDLEERGFWREAAAVYVAMLRQDTVSAPALIGLERVFAQMGRRDSVLPYAARAIAADSSNTTAWAVEVRTLRALGRDSVAAAALQRWVAAQPRSDAPYGEWARISLQGGRSGDAADAIALARERLHEPSALAPEMAQVNVARGDWSGAAAEWRRAVAAQPAYADAAAYGLRPAPVAARDAILRLLTASGAGSSWGRRLAAALLLGWNEPGRAWAMLRGVLPDAAEQRVSVLVGFAERAGALDGPGAQRAAAEAYEAAAAVASPDDAVRLRIESARSYAAAGDGPAARRLLGALASDPAAGSAARASALAATIELMVREGNPADAGRMLAADSARIAGTERAALGRLIAFGWVRLGALDRAAAAVEGDSSLAGDEVRGWVAAYRGNLAEARRLLRAAGAGGGERDRGPARAAMVSLLTAVGRDSAPALGAALLLAARGDSLQASRALTAVAAGLPGDGEAAVLSWAARFAAAGHDAAAAESLWRDVATRFPSSSAAPGAELALARLLAARGDLRGAASALEAMILAHPQSALVPEARRELDRVRGLVPGS
jgi:hypothetical protein